MSQSEEQVLSRHVWNGNRVAISKTSCSEISIYEIPQNFDPFSNQSDNHLDYSKWKCILTIDGALNDDQDAESEISFDWNPLKNSIVTCTLLKYCKLWKLVDQANGQLMKHDEILIMTNFKSPCRFVKWSRDGSRFAVGSHQFLATCFYEEESRFSFSKRKRLKSTPIAVAWHSDSQVLACVDSSNRLTVYCSTIHSDKKKIDEFGIIYMREKLEIKVNDMEFSKGGSWLVLLCANSSIVFHRFTSDRLDPSFGNNVKQTLLHGGLAFTCGLFLSDKYFVAAGYDGSPFLFELKNGGEWKLIAKMENEICENHSKHVHSLQLFHETDETVVFSSASYDNRILFWRVNK